MDKPDDTTAPVTCDRCDDGTPGKVGPCPYAHDVHGDSDDCPCNCCDYHRTQCARDI